MTPPMRSKYPLKCPSCEALDSMERIPNPNNLHTVTGCTHTYGCKTLTCIFDFAIRQPMCKDLSRVDLYVLQDARLLPSRMDWSVFE